jgi:hypothetical protein
MDPDSVTRSMARAWGHDQGKQQAALGALSAPPHLDPSPPQVANAKKGRLRWPMGNLDLWVWIPLDKVGRDHEDALQRGNGGWHRMGLGCRTRHGLM